MNKILVCCFTLFCFSSSYAETFVKIGNKEISKQEFDASYKRALQNSQSLRKFPSKKEHLEDLVRFQLGLQEAARTNVKNNPAVKNALDLTLYKGLLEVNLAKKVEKIKVSENEMKMYYKNNPQMRSGHIFIRLPQNPSTKQIAEAKKRANKIYNDVINKKRKWEVDVRAYTDDKTTAATAGDLGYHGKSSLYPAYYNALKPLKVGEIAKPVRGLYGFHIIKKTGQYSYERADKNAVKIAVFNQKRFKILDKYFSGLKKKYKVSYNNDAL